MFFGALASAFFMVSLFDDGAGGIVLNVFSAVFAMAAALHLAAAEQPAYSWVLGALALFSLALAALRGAMLLRYGGRAE